LSGLQVSSVKGLPNLRREDVLKVLGRDQLLTLAIPRQITPREAAQEPKGSLSHAKKLLKRLRQASGNPECLFYHHLHREADDLPECIRDKVVAAKTTERGRSNPCLLVSPATKQPSEFILEQHLPPSGRTMVQFQAN